MPPLIQLRANNTLLIVNPNQPEGTAHAAPPLEGAGFVQLFWPTNKEVALISLSAHPPFIGVLFVVAFVVVGLVVGVLVVGVVVLVEGNVTLFSVLEGDLGDV